MSILTANLIPYIGDNNTALLLVRIANVQWTPTGDGFEDAQLNVRVIASIGGLKKKPDEVLLIGGRRVADPIVRAKGGQNLWNSLPLQIGDYLLFALQPGPNAWKALAAWPVSGVDDPAVGGLRRSIEAQGAPESKRAEYLPALLNASDGISRHYAMANLRKPAVVTRQQAAAMIAKAFLQASALVRPQFASEMCGRSYLVPEEGAEPGNVAIWSALLQALVTEAAPQARKVWVGYLAASIGAKLDKDPAKDAELRAQIVRAIADPPRAKAGAALRAEAGANPADARIEKLAKAWGY